MNAALKQLIEQYLKVTAPNPASVFNSFLTAPEDKLTGEDYETLVNLLNLDTSLNDNEQIKAIKAELLTAINEEAEKGKSPESSDVVTAPPAPISEFRQAMLDTANAILPKLEAHHNVQKSKLTAEDKRYFTAWLSESSNQDAFIERLAKDDLTVLNSDATPAQASGIPDVLAHWIESENSRERGYTVKLPTPSEAAAPLPWASMVALYRLQRTQTYLAEQRLKTDVEVIDTEQLTATGGAGGYVEYNDNPDRFMETRRYNSELKNSVKNSSNNAEDGLNKLQTVVMDQYGNIKPLLNDVSSADNDTSNKGYYGALTRIRNNRNENSTDKFWSQAADDLNKPINDQLLKYLTPPKTESTPTPNSGAEFINYLDQLPTKGIDINSIKDTPLSPAIISQLKFHFPLIDKDKFNSLKGFLQSYVKNYQTLNKNGEQENTTPTTTAVITCIFNHVKNNETGDLNAKIYGTIADVKMANILDNSNGGFAFFMSDEYNNPCKDLRTLLDLPPENDNDNIVKVLKAALAISPAERSAFQYQLMIHITNFLATKRTLQDQEIFVANIEKLFDRYQVGSVYSPIAGTDFFDHINAKLIANTQVEKKLSGPALIWSQIKFTLIRLKENFVRNIVGFFIARDEGPSVPKPHPEAQPITSLSGEEIPAETPTPITPAATNTAPTPEPIPAVIVNEMAAQLSLQENFLATQIKGFAQDGNNAAVKSAWLTNILQTLDKIGLLSQDNPKYLTDTFTSLGLKQLSPDEKNLFLTPERQANYLLAYQAEVNNAPNVDQLMIMAGLKVLTAAEKQKFPTAEQRMNYRLAYEAEKQAMQAEAVLAKNPKFPSAHAKELRAIAKGLAEQLDFPPLPVDNAAMARLNTVEKRFEYYLNPNEFFAQIKADEELQAALATIPAAKRLSLNITTSHQVALYNAAEAEKVAINAEEILAMIPGPSSPNFTEQDSKNYTSRLSEATASRQTAITLATAAGIMFSEAQRKPLGEEPTVESIFKAMLVAPPYEPAQQPIAADNGAFIETLESITQSQQSTITYGGVELKEDIFETPDEDEKPDLQQSAQDAISNSIVATNRAGNDPILQNEAVRFHRIAANAVAQSLAAKEREGEQALKTFLNTICKGPEISTQQMILVAAIRQRLGFNNALTPTYAEVLKTIASSHQPTQQTQGHLVTAGYQPASGTATNAADAAVAAAAQAAVEQAEQMLQRPSSDTIPGMQTGHEVSRTPGNNKQSRHELK